MIPRDFIMLLAVIILCLSVLVTVLFGLIITLRRGQRGVALGTSLVADPPKRTTILAPPASVNAMPLVPGKNAHLSPDRELDTVAFGE